VVASFGIPLAVFILLFVVRGEWIDRAAWVLLILLGIIAIAMGVVAREALAEPLVRGGALVLGAGAVGVGAVETLRALELQGVLPEYVWTIGIVSLTAGSIIFTAGMVRGQHKR
jgi:hypothetical protein